MQVPSIATAYISVYTHMERWDIVQINEIHSIGNVKSDIIVMFSLRNSLSFNVTSNIWQQHLLSLMLAYIFYSWHIFDCMGIRDVNIPVDYMPG